MPLSQQIDRNGKPLSGGKLYITTTGNVPATVYKDFALTSGNTHAYPIVLDANGRIPQFWMADGTYNARLYDRSGVVQFSVASVTALGASSGAGGGGGVDAEAIFQTGDVLWLDTSGIRSGWVRDNGRTIGSATSGASERANSDVEDLFLFGWAAGWTVVSGAGATAAADWAANKQITLPDKRGYVPGGLDDMGNSAASRFTGVPVISGSVTTAGSLLGETSHTQTASEVGVHTHTATQAAHTHSITSVATNSGFQAGSGLTGLASSGSANPVTDSKQPTITVDNGGSGAAMNITQRTVLGTFYRKL